MTSRTQCAISGLDLRMLNRVCSLVKVGLVRRCSFRPDLWLLDVDEGGRSVFASIWPALVGETSPR